MSSDKTPGSSRVQAFRERLTGQYKRVEAYVTEEERARIQQVKDAQGVTTDIAVAGLIRLGLMHYEQTALAELAPPAAPARAVAATKPALMALSGALSIANSVGAPSAESPIATFFKHRKELGHDSR